MCVAVSQSLSTLSRCCKPTHIFDCFLGLGVVLGCLKKSRSLCITGEGSCVSVSFSLWMNPVMNAIQVAITETNQGEFWTTMAPNVDDYGSSAARFIATGSGQIIRGIFWVRDSTVAQLESGTIYMKSKIAPTDKPNNISPRTLRNLRRYSFLILL